MDALVSSDGFAVVLELMVNSSDDSCIKGAHNNNSRYYCLLQETIPGSGVPGSLDSAGLESPTFFLTVLSTICCDEDDDPVFRAGCGSGVLGCSIRAIPWHRSRIRETTQMDSMVVSKSSGALETGEGLAAIASD